MQMRCTRGKVFFLKNHRDLNFFLSQKPSLYIKNNRKKYSSKLKFCNFFSIYENGQNGFWSVQGEYNVFKKLLNQAKEQILFHV